VRLPAYDDRSSDARGTVAFEIRADLVLAGLASAGATVGAVMAAFDTAGNSLSPVPFDPLLLSGDRFQWGGEDWIAARRQLEEPPLTLVAAAPLTPFASPFEAAARTGTVVLAAVALASLILAALLTAGFTKRLGRLAAAADAIATGDLDRRIEPGSADEVGRVATAFNSMTENLRRTLSALALRESLAAVGEFASALAHEISNPLSAIRLDLQRVEETLDAGSPSLVMQRRALHEVDRLERTVSGALRIARSGRITRTRVDLLDPLRSAMNAALPEFASRGALLDPLAPESRDIPILGDAAALEQVFLNLLLNAGQALEPGGHARVNVVAQSDNVAVTIQDDGRGMPDESVARAFDLFFSTRKDGTGLGLSIARQIVQAHGGTIGMNSAPGQGTIVRVTLPAAPPKAIDV
jgi:signal transduction histidine kinase